MKFLRPAFVLILFIATTLVLGTQRSLPITHNRSVFAQTPENPWPMAGGNPQRTSYTPEEVRGMLCPQ